MGTLPNSRLLCPLLMRPATKGMLELIAVTKSHSMQKFSESSKKEPEKSRAERLPDKFLLLLVEGSPLAQ